MSETTKNLAYWRGKSETIAKEVRPFINGQFIDSLSTDYFIKHNPADGTVLIEPPAGAAADVDAAAAAARVAFDKGDWSGAAPAERKAVLSRLADLLEENTDDLALLETLDVGKPISDATSIDVPLSAAVLRMFAELADQINGRTLTTDNGSFAFTKRYPAGVVAGITGWNFPLALAAMKVGPALAAGNALVLKPSELSSFTTLRLAALAKEAGVPDGILNIVPGQGLTVGAALAKHGDIDMLSFTGSTSVGKLLLQYAGQSNMKRLLLECGGKSPNIVCDDFPDLDEAAMGVFSKMFWNQGQVCTAGTRLLVQRSIKDALVERLVGLAQTMTPGDPLDPATTAGPLISRIQQDKVLSYIDHGKNSGARLCFGGEQKTGDGFFVAPTIFDDVDPGASIAQEEIFGPVLAIIPFDTVDEAISIANGTIYGLSATVWTVDLAKAHAFIDGLKAGEVTVRGAGSSASGAALGAMPNQPFGQSGFGVEMGLEGLLSYTSVKSLQIFT
ncbi:MAG: aldehyde dehydrogenase family protein [Pseudomonadota bacterium]